MLRTALALASRDMAIFPCRQRSKLPATERGFLDASKDPAIVEQWWRSDPNYNIGVATGAASTGLVAVDIDGLDAELELRKLEAEYSELPPSVEVITGKGQHIWLRVPDGTDLRCSAGKLAPGCDIRANGGYVLAPPSVHPTGRRYAWSVDSADTIAAAPDWLLAKLNPSRTDAGGRSTPPPEWRELIKGVAEGARNTSATKLAGYLLRRQVDALVALELVQLWNEMRCTPPLPADDIYRIVNSIAGKELKRRGASNDHR